MRDVLTELIRSLEAGQPGAFCSLVETKGSTPQKAGAAMLVFANGGQCGTLGGGCVEAEVRQRALRFMDGDQAELLKFQLDEDYGWDDGLICGGRMNVIVEPLGSGMPAVQREYWHALHRLVSEGLGGLETVAFAPRDAVPIGARWLFDHQRRRIGGLRAGEPPSNLLSFVQDLPHRPRPSSHDGVAYLPILPRITLLIVGGGHVGQAVGRLAAEADFDIWVLDDREQFANRQRFPAAKRIFVGDIGRELQHLGETGITPSTYAIIVTRGHNHDEEALFHLAISTAGYVGMIGSKRKIRLIFDDLLAKGITQAALDRVHAPLGIDIGSQTVPEIAVSIVAELIAHRNQCGTTSVLRSRAALRTDGGP